MFWILFKAALSTLLVLLTSFLGWLAIASSGDPAIVGAAAVSLFFAVLPWVDLQQPSRVLGLAGIMLALIVCVVGLHGLFHPERFPVDCTGRRSGCNLQNVLFALGGSTLVAAPFVIPGVILLISSIRLAWRKRREPGADRR